MRAEESEMIGDGWGHADEAYHDSSLHWHSSEAKPLCISISHTTSSFLYTAMCATVVPSTIALYAVDHCKVILSPQLSTLCPG